MKSLASRLFWAYVWSVVGTFVLGAVVYYNIDATLGMKVQYAATCLAILPFQFLAWVISWFSQTPGVIDQQAIDTALTWVFLIAVAWFGGKFLLKKMKQAWAGVVGGGGGARAHH